MICEDCGNDGFTCEQCGRVQCMSCFRRYAWQASSRLCWQCQNDADKEAMAEICRGKKNVVFRTWPRKDVT